jgi:hypothetical protein
MTTNQQSTGNSTPILDLGEYGSAIVDKITGANIYARLNEMLLNDTVVIVKLDRTVTMATFCAKQIFGRLYVELGAESFFKRVLLTDASNELRYIITTGIKNALKDQANKTI